MTSKVVLDTDVLIDLLRGREVMRAFLQELAEVAGRFKRSTRSRRLELADCLIAATAFIEGAAVATGNAKDYPMPEVTVLAAR